MSWVNPISFDVQQQRKNAPWLKTVIVLIALACMGWYFLVFVFGTNVLDSHQLEIEHQQKLEEGRRTL